jgi:hypothetical protein
MEFYDAAAVFFAANHSKGAVLAFSRQTGCAYKTAWLLFKRLGYRVRAVEGCESGMKSPEIGSLRNADDAASQSVTQENQTPLWNEDDRR